MKRVVVTGIGAISPLGPDLASSWNALLKGKSGVCEIEAWRDIQGIRSCLGAPAASVDLPEHYTRKRLRSMGRAATLAVRATEMALLDAGILEDPIITSGSTGVAYGSCLSGSDTYLEIAEHCLSRDARGMQASSFTKAMSHGCAANISIFFGMKGRLIPTSSACTSGSQGIGYAAESIRCGAQKVMIAGGAEELSLPLLLLFDSMYATATSKQGISSNPRPFDISRDGLVVGEAACSLVLEELEYAKARGARIYAELVGFGTNCDGAHITAPTAETMRMVVQLSLQDAKISPKEVGFVHAHATGTTLGDTTEVNAMLPLFGAKVPFGALKSYFGHTLGACGALEAALSIFMMREGVFIPIRNLEQIDEQCQGLDLIVKEHRRLSCEHIMINNFAFGGVNSSLVFRGW
jgi:3-oxoacyl-[acyl-carrier-protein] synthase II